MTQHLDVDYLVVGAGATGMAFTDALIDHADVRVALVDRRHAAGGHWLEAYPFVRLHQSSTFYGVASTLLGGGRVQARGPEAGLHERADKAAICSYYSELVDDRMVASERVQTLWGCEYVGDRTVVSRISGRRYVVPDHCRIVDAHYLSPDIPAESGPRFAVGDGARVVPVNFLPRVDYAPGRYVVVGSGKTATDACIWLLAQGVDPDAITWIRPRDPWMLNRAKIQPDPEVFFGMVADLLEASAASASLDDLFLRLEDADIMLRVDRRATPTMAKAPTLATWELEQLRSIEHVVRLGHITTVGRGRLDLERGSVSIPGDALVVDCAADGLKRPPRIPIWQPEVITVQPIRAGFPCFGAALAGYVEATRSDDTEKNRLCPPSAYGNSLGEWALMNVLGFRNGAMFGAEPDIKKWADDVALNPARVPPGHGGSRAIDEATGRINDLVGPGVARLAELAALAGAD
ncbi:MULTISPECIES: NAD(P)-binding protein [unclassified Nocardioides]|uniref:NAD(P)-binding protein n=1 Tax=unclassified Nocardioides TaxID=2615069 RepID=UPI00362350BD